MHHTYPRFIPGNDGRSARLAWFGRVTCTTAGPEEPAVESALLDSTRTTVAEGTDAPVPISLRACARARARAPAGFFTGLERGERGAWGGTCLWKQREARATPMGERGAVTSLHM